MDLRILCAGAAQGLVKALTPSLAAEAGIGVQGAFGAVATMKEKLLAGEPCDLIVLTAALIDELAADGHLLPDTVAPLGRVATGVAVRAGEPVPEIADGAALRRTLLAASGILFPDPTRATAGIHFVNVLKRLGIHPAVEPRLAPYPNGATAMRELAQSSQPGLVGCTQITEIRYTPGVTLAGPLPDEYALHTVYSVAVCTHAAQPGHARWFADLLAGPQSQGLREAGGFET